MAKKKIAYVLHQRHGDGSITGVVTDKTNAVLWKSVDPSYRHIVEVEIDSAETIREIKKEAVKNTR